MELRLTRTDGNDRRTLGELAINDAFFCYTLEDPVREGPKIAHETAIPAGRYAVRMTFSQRFQRMLPLVEHVPGFTGIRIHPGNTPADTSGCVLVGLARTTAGELLSSRAASDTLNHQIADAQATGEPVWLTVENVPKEARA